MSWALTCVLLVVVWIAPMVTRWETHQAIAMECEKLGAFFVGDRVFECKRKDANIGAKP